MSYPSSSNGSSAKSKPVRDANGRFVRGNPGGPGNPFAHKVAALRKALINFVTVDDMKHVAFILKEKAMAGDLAAIKLLFQYVLGKPTETVNPDRLDIEEAKLQDEHFEMVEEPAMRAELYAGAAEAEDDDEDEEDADDEADAMEDEPSTNGEDTDGQETGSAMAQLAYRVGRILRDSVVASTEPPPSAIGPDGPKPQDAPSPNGGNGGRSAQRRRPPSANG